MYNMMHYYMRDPPWMDFEGHINSYNCISLNGKIMYNSLYCISGTSNLKLDMRESTSLVICLESRFRRLFRVFSVFVTRYLIVLFCIMDSNLQLARVLHCSLVYLSQNETWILLYSRACSSNALCFARGIRQMCILLGILAPTELSEKIMGWIQIIIIIIQNIVQTQILFLISKIQFSVQNHFGWIFFD